MPNVMVALPNIGGAFCSTPQSLADAHYYRVPCCNAAKMRNPLKFAGVPQTPEPISAVSGPTFTILLGHVEDILLLNRFFSDWRYMPCCEDIARQSCAMVPRWRFLATFFASCICSEPRTAHFRPAFQIRTKATPCVWCGLSVVDIQCAMAEINRRGKKKIEDRRNHRARI